MKQTGKPSLLVRTKFAPPRLTRTPVHREKALQALSAGLTRAITLIKAPAGFGKTTLLTAWREHLLARKAIVAWLTLDQDDNDENRFLEYLTGTLVAALGTRADDAPELGPEGKVVSVRTQLTSLINALDHIGEEITLILDDYDKIDNPTVHALIAFLLSHIPPNLHLVAACRAEPPIPLASLRASDQLVEMDTNAMRFGFEDTQTFFRQSISTTLAADEMRAIHDATEGWVAGLQIAALSMPGRTGLNSLIARLPRHSRALSDYLVENVFARIPAETVDFMLRTAVLDRLNGALCEHLTGTPHAATTLEWLVKQNLFLLPLDDDGSWYRYHGLFAEFLLNQLQRSKPDEVPRLHLRAAEWFSAHQQWTEAVRHALAADRVDLAAEWMERCALAELRKSRVHNFLGWVDKLPEDALRQRPGLAIAYIWALILTIQADRAQALVDVIDAQLRDQPTANSAALRSTLRAQRVSILSLQDRVSEALELGRQVWAERFPDDRKPQGGFDGIDEAFLNVMLHLYRKVGDLEAARRVANFYRPSEDVTFNLFMTSYRACLYAKLEIQENQMRSAARGLEETLEICEQHEGRRSAAATLVAAALASIYYQWNRLDAVEDLLADRFDIINDVCSIEPLQSAYLSMARLRSAQGQFDAAHAFLDRLESVTERRHWPRLRAITLAERANLWLKENRHQDAERAIDTLDTLVANILHSEPRIVDVVTRARCARARLRLHLGQADAAQALLDTALAGDDTGGTANVTAPYDAAHLRLLLALACHQLGDEVRAQAELSRVLPVTEHDDVVRMLVDEGPALVPLLQARLATTPAGTPHAAYLIRLLDAFGIEPAAAAPAPPVAEPVDENTFSLREQAVLELVTQKLSNKQIAKTLFITPETVKWHMKNIYRKIGASDRRLAARTGRAMHQAPGND